MYLKTLKENIKRLLDLVIQQGCTVQGQNTKIHMCDGILLSHKKKMKCCHLPEHDGPRDCHSK